MVRPGLIGRVKHLRGEADLRHASLQAHYTPAGMLAPPLALLPAKNRPAAVGGQRAVLPKS